MGFARRPGQVNIAQVAAEAGVSTATVSRVYNRDARVAPATRDRVMAVGRRLGYLPNAHARGIRRQSASAIACIMPACSDHYFSQLTNSVILAAQAAGLAVYLQSSDSDPDMQEQCLARIAQVGVDGLLFAPLGELDADCFRRHGLHLLPKVIMQRRQVMPGLPHVYHNDQESGYTATKFLLRLRRRRIFFFAGVWNPAALEGVCYLDVLRSPARGAYSAFDRLAGHIRALEEAGMAFDPSLYAVTSFDFDSGYHACRRLLASLKEFDAIVCANDSVASGVLQALSEQNIKVPEQVSIIGCDDSVFATIARPMLTSIHQDPLLMGRHAVDMLTRLMRGESVDSRVIDTQLTVRQSTAMPTAQAAQGEDRQ